LGDGIGEDSFDDIALLGEEGDYPAHFEDVGLAPRFVFHKGFPEGSNNDDDSLFRVDGQVEPVELEIEGSKASAKSALVFSAVGMALLYQILEVIRP